MEVIIISKTIQKFNGESFYRCGEYFQHKGKRLHRTVWEYHNGTVPKGYHVHHKDGDKSNNNIENLSLLLGKTHLSEHMKAAERISSAKINIKKAIKAAPEWHRSDEGREWHSKSAKANWEKRTPQTYKCSYCGKDFQTKYIYPENSNHFCHQNCKAAFRRRRLRNED